MKLRDKRRFRWVSSVTGSTEERAELAGLEQRMAEFYARQVQRLSYQEMLNTENDLPFEGSTAQHLLYQLCEGQPRNVLEVGCGNGRLYRQLRAFDYDSAYTGVEVAPYIVEENRSRHPEATWECASGDNLPFEDAEFDACFSFYVLDTACIPIEFWKRC